MVYKGFRDWIRCKTEKFQICWLCCIKLVNNPIHCWKPLNHCLQLVTFFRILSKKYSLCQLNTSISLLSAFLESSLAFNFPTGLVSIYIIFNIYSGSWDTLYTSAVLHSCSSWDRHQNFIKYKLFTYNFYIYPVLVKKMVNCWCCKTEGGKYKAVTWSDQWMPLSS